MSFKKHALFMVEDGNVCAMTRPDGLGSVSYVRSFSERLLRCTLLF